MEGYNDALMEYRVSKRCNHATVRSRKSFQRLHKIWVFNEKCTIYHSFTFLGNSCNFLGVFWPIFCAKLSDKNVGCEKN